MKIVYLLATWACLLVLGLAWAFPFQILVSLAAMILGAGFLFKFNQAVHVSR